MRSTEPLSANMLTNIFRTSAKDPYRIINRESRTIEFKESYNHSGMAQYFKTMAAFANNEGGYIIFGVSDSPRRLVGLKEKNLNQFENIKVEEFTKNLQEYFSPEIRWDHCTFEFKGMSFGVIYTESLRKKPCICKKAYDDVNPKYALREGDIFYRYGGRSERIKYTELSAIIENTRKNEEQQWIEFLQRVAKVGIENACLFDVERTCITGSGGSLLIDEKLIDKIAFIREGEFVEKKGKPTLRLVGDVESIGSGKIIVSGDTKKIVKGIEPENIVRAFLLEEKVAEPIEYIKRICSEATGNYPFYFLLSQIDMSIEEIKEIIQETTSRARGKDYLLERLTGKRIQQTKLSVSLNSASIIKSKYRDEWLADNVCIIEEELKYCVSSMLTIDDQDLIEHKSYIKKTLLLIFETYYENVDSNLAGDIRKAICRLDEVLFSTNLHYD